MKCGEPPRPKLDAAHRADSARSSRTFYPAVQGMRGLASVSVLGIHLSRMAEHAGFLPGGLPWLFTVSTATLGHGVELFFVISGFVIPASLVRHGDLKRFFTDRILRIVPLYAILHAVVFAIGPMIGYKWLLGVSLIRYVMLFVTNLLFIAPLLGLPVAQQNSWTLTYEWIFYGAIACVWAAARGPWRRALTPAIAIGAVGVCLVWPACAFFVLGMLFARLGRASLVIPRAAEACVLLLAITWFYGAAQYLHLIAALPPAAVIFALALTPGSMTSAVLSQPWFQFLGRISYSLYLVHPVALFPFQQLGGHLAAVGVPRGALFASFVVLGPVATVLASVLTHRFVELRAREWLAARLGATHSGPASRGPTTASTIGASR